MIGSGLLLVGLLLAQPGAYGAAEALLPPPSEQCRTLLTYLMSAGPMHTETLVVESCLRIHGAAQSRMLRLNRVLDLDGRQVTGELLELRWPGETPEPTVVLPYYQGPLVP